MTTGIVLADTAGRIVACDDGAVALLGHPADVAVGASVDLIAAPTFREAHCAAAVHASPAGTEVAWGDVVSGPDGVP